MENVFYEEWTDREFYYQNLTGGYAVNKKAKEILEKEFDYNYEELCKIENMREIGIVEYVANGDFKIENNLIIRGE